MTNQTWIHPSKELEMKDREYRGLTASDYRRINQITYPKTPISRGQATAFARELPLPIHVYDTGRIDTDWAIDPLPDRGVNTFELEQTPSRKSENYTMKSMVDNRTNLRGFFYGASPFAVAQDKQLAGIPYKEKGWYSNTLDFLTMPLTVPARLTGLPSLGDMTNWIYNNWDFDEVHDMIGRVDPNFDPATNGWKDSIDTFFGKDQGDLVRGALIQNGWIPETTGIGSKNNQAYLYGIKRRLREISNNQWAEDYIVKHNYDPRHGFSRLMFDIVTDYELIVDLPITMGLGAVGKVAGVGAKLARANSITQKTASSIAKGTVVKGQWFNNTAGKRVAMDLVNAEGNVVQSIRLSQADELMELGLLSKTDLVVTKQGKQLAVALMDTKHGKRFVGRRNKIPVVTKDGRVLNVSKSGKGRFSPLIDIDAITLRAVDAESTKLALQFERKAKHLEFWGKAASKAENVLDFLSFGQTGRHIGYSGRQFIRQAAAGGVWGMPAGAGMYIQQHADEKLMADLYYGEGQVDMPFSWGRLAATSVMFGTIGVALGGLLGGVMGGYFKNWFQEAKKYGWSPSKTWENAIMAKPKTYLGIDTLDDLAATMSEERAMLFLGEMIDKATATRGAGTSILDKTTIESHHRLIFEVAEFVDYISTALNHQYLPIEMLEDLIQDFIQKGLKNKKAATPAEILAKKRAYARSVANKLRRKAIQEGNPNYTIYHLPLLDFDRVKTAQLENGTQLLRNANEKARKVRLAAEEAKAQLKEKGAVDDELAKKYQRLLKEYEDLVETLPIHPLDEMPSIKFKDYDFTTAGESGILIGKLLNQSKDVITARNSALPDEEIARRTAAFNKTLREIDTLHPREDKLTRDDVFSNDLEVLMSRIREADGGGDQLSDEMRQNLMNKLVAVLGGRDLAGDKAASHAWFNKIMNESGLGQVAITLATLGTGEKNATYHAFSMIRMLAEMVDNSQEALISDVANFGRMKSVWSAQRLAYRDTAWVHSTGNAIERDIGFDGYQFIQRALHDWYGTGEDLTREAIQKEFSHLNDAGIDRYLGHYYEYKEATTSYFKQYEKLGQEMQLIHKMEEDARYLPLLFPDTMPAKHIEKVGKLGWEVKVKELIEKDAVSTHELAIIWKFQMDEKNGAVIGIKNIQAPGPDGTGGSPLYIKGMNEEEMNAHWWGVLKNATREDINAIQREIDKARGDSGLEIFAKDGILLDEVGLSDDVLLAKRKVQAERHITNTQTKINEHMTAENYVNAAYSVFNLVRQAQDNMASAPEAAKAALSEALRIRDILHKKHGIEIIDPFGKARTVDDNWIVIHEIKRHKKTPENQGGIVTRTDSPEIRINGILRDENKARVTIDPNLVPSDVPIVRMLDDVDVILAKGDTVIRKPIKGEDPTSQIPMVIQEIKESRITPTQTYEEWAISIGDQILYKNINDALKAGVDINTIPELWTQKIDLVSMLSLEEFIRLADKNRARIGARAERKNIGGEIKGEMIDSTRLAHGGWMKDLKFGTGMDQIGSNWLFHYFSGRLFGFDQEMLISMLTNPAMVKRKPGEELNFEVAIQRWLDEPLDEDHVTKVYEKVITTAMKAGLPYDEASAKALGIKVIPADPKIKSQVQKLMKGSSIDKRVPISKELGEPMAYIKGLDEPIPVKELEFVTAVAPTTNTGSVRQKLQHEASQGLSPDTPKSDWFVLGIEGLQRYVSEITGKNISPYKLGFGGIHSKGGARDFFKNSGLMPHEILDVLNSDIGFKFNLALAAQHNINVEEFVISYINQLARTFRNQNRRKAHDYHLNNQPIPPANPPGSKRGVDIVQSAERLRNLTEEDFTSPEGQRLLFEITGNNEIGRKEAQELADRFTHMWEVYSRDLNDWENLRLEDILEGVHTLKQEMVNENLARISRGEQPIHSRDDIRARVDQEYPDVKWENDGSELAMTGTGQSTSLIRTMEDELAPAPKKPTPTKPKEVDEVIPTEAEIKTEIQNTSDKNTKKFIEETEAAEELGITRKAYLADKSKWDKKLRRDRKRKTFVKDSNTMLRKLRGQLELINDNLDTIQRQGLSPEIKARQLELLEQETDLIGQIAILEAAQHTPVNPQRIVQLEADKVVLIESMKTLEDIDPAVILSNIITDTLDEKFGFHGLTAAEFKNRTKWFKGKVTQADKKKAALKADRDQHKKGTKVYKRKHEKFHIASTNHGKLRTQLEKVQQVAVLLDNPQVIKDIQIQQKTQAIADIDDKIHYFTNIKTKERGGVTDAIRQTEAKLRTVRKKQEQLATGDSLQAKAVALELEIERVKFVRELASKQHKAAEDGVVIVYKEDVAIPKALRGRGKRGRYAKIEYKDISVEELLHNPPSQARIANRLDKEIAKEQHEQAKKVLEELRKTWFDTEAKNSMDHFYTLWSAGGEKGRHIYDSLVDTVHRRVLTRLVKGQNITRDEVEDMVQELLTLVFMRDKGHKGRFDATAVQDFHFPVPSNLKDLSEDELADALTKGLAGENSVVAAWSPSQYANEKNLWHFKMVEEPVKVNGKPVYKTTFVKDAKGNKVPLMHKGKQRTETILLRDEKGKKVPKLDKDDNPVLNKKGEPQYQTFERKLWKTKDVLDENKKKVAKTRWVQRKRPKGEAFKSGEKSNLPVGHFVVKAAEVIQKRHQKGSRASLLQKKGKRIESLDTHWASIDDAKPVGHTGMFMKTGDPYGLPVPTMVARESREKLHEALDLFFEPIPRPDSTDKNVIASWEAKVRVQDRQKALVEMIAEEPNWTKENAEKSLYYPPGIAKRAKVGSSYKHPKYQESKLKIRVVVNRLRSMGHNASYDTVAKDLGKLGRFYKAVYSGYGQNDLNGNVALFKDLSEFMNSLFTEAKPKYLRGKRIKGETVLEDKPVGIEWVIGRPTKELYRVDFSVIDESVAASSMFEKTQKFMQEYTALVNKRNVDPSMMGAEKGKLTKEINALRKQYQDDYIEFLEDSLVFSPDAHKYIELELERVNGILSRDKNPTVAKLYEHEQFRKKGIQPRNIDARKLSQAQKDALIWTNEEITNITLARSQKVILESFQERIVKNPSELIMVDPETAVKDLLKFEVTKKKAKPFTEIPRFWSDEDPQYKVLLFLNDFLGDDAAARKSFPDELKSLDLQEMKKTGLIETHNRKWRITEAGRTFLAREEQQVIKVLPIDKKVWNKLKDKAHYRELDPDGFTLQDKQRLLTLENNLAAARARGDLTAIGLYQAEIHNIRLSVETPAAKESAALFDQLRAVTVELEKINDGLVANQLPDVAVETIEQTIKNPLKSVTALWEDAGMFGAKNRKLLAAYADLRQLQIHLELEKARIIKRLQTLTGKGSAVKKPTMFLNDPNAQIFRGEPKKAVTAPIETVEKAAEVAAAPAAASHFPKGVTAETMNLNYHGHDHATSASSKVWDAYKGSKKHYPAEALRPRQKGGLGSGDVTALQDVLHNWAGRLNREHTSRASNPSDSYRAIEGSPHAGVNQRVFTTEQIMSNPEFRSLFETDFRKLTAHYARTMGATIRAQEVLNQWLKHLDITDDDRGLLLKNLRWTDVFAELKNQIENLNNIKRSDGGGELGLLSAQQRKALQGGIEIAEKAYMDMVGSPNYHADPTGALDRVASISNHTAQAMFGPGISATVALVEIPMAILARNGDLGGLAKGLSILARDFKNMGSPDQTELAGTAFILDNFLHSGIHRYDALNGLDMEYSIGRRVRKAWNDMFRGVEEGDTKLFGSGHALMVNVDNFLEGLSKIGGEVTGLRHSILMVKNIAVGKAKRDMILNYDKLMRFSKALDIKELEKLGSMKVSKDYSTDVSDAMLKYIKGVARQEGLNENLAWRWYRAGLAGTMDGVDLNDIITHLFRMGKPTKDSFNLAEIQKTLVKSELPFGQTGRALYEDTFDKMALFIEMHAHDLSPEPRGLSNFHLFKHPVGRLLSFYITYPLAFFKTYMQKHPSEMGTLGALGMLLTITGMEMFHQQVRALMRGEDPQELADKWSKNPWAMMFREGSHTPWLGYSHNILRSVSISPVTNTFIGDPNYAPNMLNAAGMTAIDKGLRGVQDVAAKGNILTRGMTEASRTPDMLDRGMAAMTGSEDRQMSHLAEFFSEILLPTRAFWWKGLDMAFQADFNPNEEAALNNVFKAWGPTIQQLALSDPERAQELITRIKETYVSSTAVERSRDIDVKDIRRSGRPTYIPPTPKGRQQPILHRRDSKHEWIKSRSTTAPVQTILSQPSSIPLPTGLNP